MGFSAFFSLSSYQGSWRGRFGGGGGGGSYPRKIISQDRRTAEKDEWMNGCMHACMQGERARQHHMACWMLISTRCSVGADENM